MTFETGVSTPGVLLDADSGSAAIAVEFTINDVESGLVFVKAHLEIHRFARVVARWPERSEVGSTPFDVEDPVRGTAADRGEDAAGGGVRAKEIRESEDGIVEKAMRHAADSEVP